MRESLKTNKGITLVALVVTIIVLILLAAVSINLVLGENGILTKAQEGAQNYMVASNTEQQEMENAVKFMNGDNTPDDEGKETLVSQITAANYGDSVAYSVKVGDVTLDNWKIFYNDPKTNNVIMIYNDYLPNSTGLATGAGLVTSGDYGVKSSTNREDLINNLNDTSKWTSLVRSDLTGKATAKGAVDLETWVNSWNAKGYQKLYTAKKTGMSDSIGWGYYVGTSENPTSTYQDVSSFAGYNDALYYPVKVSEEKDWSYGYLLASPCSWDPLCLSSIYFEGSIADARYDWADYSLCPIIYLSSNILTSGKDASGAWVIE